MDDHRFDTLMRRLAESSWSRRRLSGVLASWILALLIASDAPDASAKKKRRRKKKRKGRNGGTNCQAVDQACVSDGECCSGNCANLPSSEQAVCRRQMCSPQSETCQTHGDCCSGGCFDNTKVCFG